MARWLQSFWRDILLSSDVRRRRRLAAATLALVVIIGLLDLLLWPELSLLAFYCLPVVLGTAAQGWKFGLTMALASVAMWIAGDLAVGVHYKHWVVPWWNAVIALSTPSA